MDLVWVTLIAELLLVLLLYGEWRLRKLGCKRPVWEPSDGRLIIFGLLFLLGMSGFFWLILTIGEAVWRRWWTIILLVIEVWWFINYHWVFLPRRKW